MRTSPWNRASRGHAAAGANLRLISERHCGHLMVACACSMDGILRFCNWGIKDPYKIIFTRKAPRGVAIRRFAFRYDTIAVAF